jgi:hypothetical protein
VPRPLRLSTKVGSVDGSLKITQRGALLSGVHLNVLAVITVVRLGLVTSSRKLKELQCLYLVQVVEVFLYQKQLKLQRGQVHLGCHNLQLLMAFIAVLWAGAKQNNTFRLCDCIWIIRIECANKTAITIIGTNRSD